MRSTCFALVTAVAVPLAAKSQFTAPHADFMVTAADFSFEIPREVPAGWRTVRFRNTGREFHHAVFLRVPDERAADSAVAALATWKEDWDRAVPGTVSIGGVESHFTDRPGEDTYAILDLRPGLYLVLCMIPSDRGLHVTRGMHALLRVTATAAIGPPPPSPEARLHARDYAYRLTKNHFTPGWHLIEVSSDGPSEHVAEFARLKDGRHMSDVLAAAGTPNADDPEASTVGGTARLASGKRAFVWVHFSPGVYVVQCPLHTSAHRPHLRQGMITEFEVR
jgi:hypothetical protein